MMRAMWYQYVGEGTSLPATAVAEARVEVLDREARRRELLLGLGVERAVVPAGAAGPGHRVLRIE